jgi:hypothetical protein
MKIERIYYTASPVIRSTSTGTIPTSDILSLFKNVVEFLNRATNLCTNFSLFLVFVLCIVLNTTIMTNRSLKRGKRLVYSGIGWVNTTRRTLMSSSPVSPLRGSTTRRTLLFFSCLISPGFYNSKNSDEFFEL